MSSPKKLSNTPIGQYFQSFIIDFYQIDYNSAPWKLTTSSRLAKHFWLKLKRNGFPHSQLVQVLKDSITSMTHTPRFWDLQKLLFAFESASSALSQFESSDSKRLKKYFTNRSEGIQQIIDLYWYYERVNTSSNKDPNWYVHYKWYGKDWDDYKKCLQMINKEMNLTSEMEQRIEVVLVKVIDQIKDDENDERVEGGVKG